MDRIGELYELLTKTNLPESCWEWQGSRNVKGYGRVRRGPRGVDRIYLAHRAMYEAVHGPILSGRQVLHTCDNPPCINPLHLYLGDPADNANDRTLRGRGRCKLTASQVRLIRQAYDSGVWNITELARDFGVSQATIHAVVHRTAWKHVE